MSSREHDSHKDSAEQQDVRTRHSHTHTHTHTQCVCVCVFVFAYVCCNRMRAHLCERARGPVFADVCMHVRMRVYAHTYMYLYV